MNNAQGRGVPARGVQHAAPDHLQQLYAEAMDYGRRYEDYFRYWKMRRTGRA